MQVLISLKLGEENGEEYCRYYDITPEGNFERFNIPNLIKGEIQAQDKDFIEECRRKLFEQREKRMHPYKDDKILTSWNGLMIAAMAIGSRVLEDENYSHAAEKAADFILSKLVREDGRLLARYRMGDSAYPAYAEDYAFLIWGLIELYETTYRPEYLKKALKLNDDLLKYFWDEDHGGLFMYGSDSEQLITRPKEIYDGAVPSGNSVATLNFLKLARLTGLHELEGKAQQQFKTFGGNIKRAARGYTFLLTSLLYAQAVTKEVVVAGNTGHKDTDIMLKIIDETFRPFTLSILYSDEHKDLKTIIPFIENYKTVEGKATAYVCENFACREPITDPNVLRPALLH